jgi:hypothetical protein
VSASDKGLISTVSYKLVAISRFRVKTSYKKTLDNHGGGSYACAQKQQLKDAHIQIGSGCVLPVLSCKRRLLHLSAFADAAS